MTITNRVQVVKGIMVRTTQDTVKPELVLNDVVPALVNYRTAVTANLQNTQPTMIGEMKVVAEVTKKGSKDIIKKEVKEGLEMAPNSNFDFPIMWNNQPLEPGTYTLHLVATSRGEEWKFTKDFTIKKEESKALNEEAVELVEPEGMPMWVYIIIGLLGMIVLLLIFLLLRKSKKEDKK
ncbi:MAG: DUF3324 domain-containing protein [Vagococcus sp.]